MNQEKLLQDVATLPSAAQQEVIDFIAFLKLRYDQYTVQSNNNLSAIESEPFIGMWQNRSDLTDSISWVRNLRKKEWG
jgi:hypothetical protein